MSDRLKSIPYHTITECKDEESEYLSTSPGLEQFIVLHFFT